MASCQRKLHLWLPQRGTPVKPLAVLLEERTMEEGESKESESKEKERK